jgi:hypothetical protein
MDVSENSLAIYDLDNFRIKDKDSDSGELDFELVYEDAQGHHTFNASSEMTKVIFSFLAAL